MYFHLAFLRFMLFNNCTPEIEMDRVALRPSRLTDSAKLKQMLEITGTLVPVSADAETARCCQTVLSVVK